MMANFGAKHQTWPYNLQSALGVSRNYHELDGDGVASWIWHGDLTGDADVKNWELDQEFVGQKGDKARNESQIQYLCRNVDAGNTGVVICLDADVSRCCKACCQHVHWTLPFAPEKKSWTLNACSRPRITKTWYQHISTPFCRNPRLELQNRSIGQSSARGSRPWLPPHWPWHASLCRCLRRCQRVAGQHRGQHRGSASAENSTHLHDGPWMALAMFRFLYFNWWLGIFGHSVCVSFYFSI